jgi:hypothetical protein
LAHSYAHEILFIYRKTLICWGLRKIAAILLCGIFFFNWVGYRFLTGMMEEDATRRLDARLDRQQYSEDQMITIKVPITNLAYYNNSARYERSSGQIEINGIPYRYVKRRIYHDSLEMMCIPNQGALQLRQSGKNYFSGVNDLEQQQGAKSPTHAHKSFLSDPYIGIRSIRPDMQAFIVILRGNPHAAELLSLSLPTDDRPPTVVA